MTKEMSHNIQLQGFQVFKNFLSASDVSQEFIDCLKTADKFVDGVITDIPAPYMASIRKKITANKKTPFSTLCIKILDQRLKKSGVLKSKQSVLTRTFGINDFSNRKIYRIIQNKYKNINFSLILFLFKKKRILFKEKPVKSLNTLVDIESEKFLEIKV